MVNILLELFDIDAPWLYQTLRHYILPTHKVAVVALSFDAKKVCTQTAWDALYHKQTGKYYAPIADALMAYGIPEENITFLNYFAADRQSVLDTIREADILYFPGGLPDKMLDNIKAMGIYEAILAHKGIVMGFSAGADIQLAEYHLSPDEDYPDFGYYEGLPLLSGFYLEVHYEGTPVQDAAIRKVLAERGKPVYATAFGKGALLIDNGKLQLLGDVKVFTP